AENQPDEVIRWYDRRERGQQAWSWSGPQDGRVAEAVEGVYPDRAIGIWKEMAENQIAQTQTKAYEVAARYLRKVQRLLEQLGREEEWRSYLAELRQANARKRRLLETLDKMAAGRIIDGR
ncbi:MAG: SWIM zinc finger domain-containing protein, partial [Anaerolineae bacterium]|nr:SWIM zinc finger domain-containing protein [Anaerolineae bacterium]